jgi:AcrR family transcriptional regulator
MSIVVEHERRRKEILKKALDVFVNDGFENATFQKIADRCGITRTTLYIYFKNKKEIFKYSIKQLSSTIEEDIKGFLSNVSLSSTEKITNVLMHIFQHLEENRRLLSVVLNYLLNLTKNDGDPEELVRRRTVRLRRIFVSLVTEGTRSGELKSVSAKTADDFLYSFIEAAIFRLVVLQRKTVGDLRKTAVFAVKQFAMIG